MIRLAVAARTDVGRERTTNEDAILIADLSAAGVQQAVPGVVRFGVSDRGALLAIADGMGGHQKGDVASALTLASVHSALVEPSAGGPDERVQHAVEHANRDVFRAGRAHEKARRMGATLTAVLVEGSTAHIAEVGDSRAYVLRDGEVQQVTHDQSLVQALIDRGALAVQDAATSPTRNILLQAIGQLPDVVVAMGSLELRQRDCLLLCSDGLWGKLTEAELRDVVLAAPSLDVACERLVELANERGGEDNITVLLAGVSGDLPPPVPGEAIASTLTALTTFEAQA